MKHLKKFKTFIAISSLGFFVLVACAAGPIVTVGISDPTNLGMQVTDKDGKTSFMSYEKTENWICYPPEDHRTVVEYYKREIQYWKDRAND